MAGIYLHIPFCKQRCSYCDFHFSVNLKRKPALVDALTKELQDRSAYLNHQTVETIYFGGGTPSLLTEKELKTLLHTIHDLFAVVENPEITLECNPDDISVETLAIWKKAGINRLSIGIQSFVDEDLQFMKRAHSANEALNSLQLALKSGFTNLTVDLIFGTPTLTDDQLLQNLQTVMQLNIPHISVYGLTVEEKTELAANIRHGKIPPLDEEQSVRQFQLVMNELRKRGYEQYEISNYCHPGFQSKHNSSYWHGKHYLGVGPSAHSFDGHSRSWNVRNNALYIQQVQDGTPYFELEMLSKADQFNEYIMTALRLSTGIEESFIHDRFGSTIHSTLMMNASKYLSSGEIRHENGHFVLTEKGKLVADKIASDLFVTDDINN